MPSEFQVPEFDAHESISLNQVSTEYRAQSIVDQDLRESKVLQRQVQTPEVQVGFFSLYRYATSYDLAVLAVSSICAMVGGAVLPLVTVRVFSNHPLQKVRLMVLQLVIGSLAGKFQYFFLNPVAHLRHEISELCLWFVYLAIVEFITISVATIGFIVVGDRITQRTRVEYLKAILRQNVAFFDRIGAGEVATSVTTGTTLVQDAISQKAVLALTALSNFTSAIILIFAKSWRFGLLSLATIVVMVMLMGFLSRLGVKYSRRALVLYANGESIAEEAIRSFRITAAFGAQRKLAEQYDGHLQRAGRFGARAKVILGLSIGAMLGTIMLNYGLQFWMGSRFLTDRQSNLADIVTVIYATIVAAMSLGSLAPHLQAFLSGIAASSTIYSTIERNSPMDPFSTSGTNLEDATWDPTIEFKQVRMVYPERPEVRVLDDFSLVIPPGKVTAIVGASGSGKTTLIGMIERFYEPIRGDVLLCGESIAKLNLRWLREQISVVEQEPSLFSATIYDNIRHGLSTSQKLSSTAEHASVLDAAKIANAHEFICSLPKGYNTKVGENGLLLSGGQRQRIALARAIVRKPRILILDEATSALDSKSETVVQLALDAVTSAPGRTTIVIAHRLSTIKAADNIVVMNNGTIVEEGTHEELISRNGTYTNLVAAQNGAGSTSNNNHFQTLSNEISEAVNRENPVVLDEKFLESEEPLASKNVDAEPTQEHQPSLFSLIRLVASLNLSDASWMLLGISCSIIAGGGTPTQAVFFAKAVEALALPLTESRKIRSQVNFWALMYLMLGLVVLITYCVHGYAFGKCSERLVQRARSKAFRSILRQDMKFFETHQAGSLIAFLSTETTLLAGLSGSTLGTLLTATTTLTASVVIAIIFGWKLGLVGTATVPVLLGAGFTRLQLLTKLEVKARQAYGDAANVASEAVSAIRTVLTLGREEAICREYQAMLEISSREHTKSIILPSMLYAATQALPSLCTALSFWYGGKLITDEGYTLFQFFVCFTEIVFGAQAAGTIFSTSPDIGKSRQAAASLQELFRRQPEIDINAPGEPLPHILSAKVELRDVSFTYPSRTMPAMDGLNITIEPGQNVALVGESGSGKSTVVAVLERFYDPSHGSVLLDDCNVRGLDLTQYRSIFALVSQEPTLYQGSIRQNVLFGMKDEASVPEEKIIRACKDANIYDFIMSLP